MDSGDKFINHYSLIPQKSGLRPFLRDKVLDFFGTFNKPPSEEAVVQFVYLHHIFDDEIKPFRNLLSELSKTYEFISHSEAVNRILSGEIDRPYLSFSWDDGFKNCIVAADLLSEFGAKGCFFICPELIGVNDIQKIKTFNRNKLNFPPVEYLNWDEVETLVKQGHEIGSHTLSHIRISQTSPEQALEEIFQSAEVLRQKIGQPGHFAWPYGKFSDFTSTARKTVFDAGFQSCASAVRGAHPTSEKKVDKEQLCIRRDHIVAAWPLSHSLYFIYKSTKEAKENNHYWPLNFSN